MKPRQTQRGVALITALLLVAIATGIAAKIAWDNQISLRRTDTTLSMEQARQIAVSGEAIAMEFVERVDSDIEFDIQEDPFFNPQGVEFPIFIDELPIGIIRGVLTDAQGKLNVNNLVQNGQVDPVAKEQFERLFSALGLNQNIVDEIIDWIDEDDQTTGSGAEDSAYTSQKPPYRAANKYLMDISELRSVLSIDEKAYELLVEHVTAIPPGWCGSGLASGSLVVPVNLNFATWAVFMALDPSISKAAAIEDYAARAASPGFKSMAEVQLPGSSAAIQGSYAVVKTNCFKLSVQAVIGSTPLTMYSLLDRSATTGQFVVRTRTFGLDL